VTNGSSGLKHHHPNIASSKHPPFPTEKKRKEKKRRRKKSNREEYAEAELLLQKHCPNLQIDSPLFPFIQLCAHRHC